MKKLILITIMLLSTLAFASRVDQWTLPTESGKYHTHVEELKYSDGEDIEVGKGYIYTAWKNTKWYKFHWIECTITDIISINDSLHVLRLDCIVSERAQFGLPNVTYYDLNGYRTNGTLKWSRDEVGSTDIHCYDKSGMTVVKRVNNPSYCK